jgi:myosin heavy subunit
MENVAPQVANALLTGQPRSGKQPASVTAKVKRGGKTGAGRISVDIVTGQKLVSVYFDPQQCPDAAADCADHDWMGRHLYVPAAIIKEDAENGLLSVRLGSGEVYKVSSSNAVKVRDQDDDGVDDILQLKEFSEMSLIHTLRVRYARDEIYTFVGPILISINPYKWLKDMYSEHTMLSYHGGDRRTLPPHLFVLAEATYASLMQSFSSKVRDQSIIISGESGAGKTEATKVIMTYLARITLLDHQDKDFATQQEQTSVGELEQRVLNTNPMLEAFGNARTLRNDNSSRFGKFIELAFAPGRRGKALATNGAECTGGSDGAAAVLVGAAIKTYLLEKVRA